MASETLREFLVSLGFHVNQEQHKKFIESLTEATAAGDLLAEGIKRTAETVVEAVKSTAEGFNQMYFTSQRTEASVKNIQAFIYAAKQLNVPEAEATGALRAFSEVLQHNREFEQTLRDKLNIQTRDASSGAWRDMSLIFRDYGAALATIQNAATKEMFGKYFAQDPWSDLMRALQNPDFSKLAEEKTKLDEALGIDHKSITDSAHEFSTTWESVMDKLNTEATKLESSAMTKLLSPLKLANEWLDTWLPKIDEFLTALTGGGSAQSQKPGGHNTDRKWDDPGVNTVRGGQEGTGAPRPDQNASATWTIALAKIFVGSHKILWEKVFEKIGSGASWFSAVTADRPKGDRMNPVVVKNVDDDNMPSGAGLPPPPGASGEAPQASPLEGPVKIKPMGSSGDNTPIETSAEYPGINFKGGPNGQATAGGPAGKGIVALAQNLPAGSIVTALNDAYHKWSRSNHAVGNAMDYVPPGGNMEAERNRQRAQLTSMGLTESNRDGGGDFWIEPGWMGGTGPHVHVTMSPQGQRKYLDALARRNRPAVEPVFPTVPLHVPSARITPLDGEPVKESTEPHDRGASIQSSPHTEVNIYAAKSGHGTTQAVHPGDRVAERLMANLQGATQ